VETAGTSTEFPARTPESRTFDAPKDVPRRSRYAVAPEIACHANVVLPLARTEPLLGDTSVAIGMPVEPNVKSRKDHVPAVFVPIRAKYEPAGSCGTETLVERISPESKTSPAPAAVPTRRE
jgi:hypothetical protein